MEAEQTVETFVAEDAGREFLGQWNRLVSTTNWEKGRIIANWRQALVAAGAQPQEYSDEAWSRQVGNVSGQHVGRLRRVYERFGAVRNDYSGLYWSHYQAALDWDDAEMWLEGAVQNRWSISQMRYQRWEVLGRPAGEQPHDDDVVSAELDEDSHEPSATPQTEAASKVDVVHDVDGGPDYSQGPDFGDEAPFDESAGGTMEGTPFDAASGEYPGGEAAPAPVRPFAHLAELPDDLAQALESFKLGILRHKLAGWNEVALEDVLSALEALKQLALAPAAE
jgi:hypothetical protein